MDWLINTGGFCYKSLVEDLEMSIEIFKSEEEFHGITSQEFMMKNQIH